MFPIIWRFLFTEYFKVMGFCVAAFVTVLLVMRLDDVVHFASMEASFGTLLLFILYQIPYILPIAIPISCLISSILLVQHLSKTHELTALRSCGMSLRDLLMPILFGAALISFFNFYIVSEVASSVHLTTSKWKSELRSINPLLLLHNKHLMRMKGGYFNTLGPSKYGEWAEGVVIATPNKKDAGINLFLAKKLKGNKDSLIGSGISLISTKGSHEGDGFDNLIIENIQKMSVSSKDFSYLLQNKNLQINNDHLQLGHLLARIKENREALTIAKKEGFSKEEQKNLKNIGNRCLSEIVRRISLALAAFTFTLMGASFGISISRNPSNSSVFYVICLAAFYLMSYFIAEGLGHHFVLSWLFYLIPHIVLTVLSLKMLVKISKGIE